MSAANINRDTALRIALAARALPGVSVGVFMDVLTQRIKGELNEESLGGITVTDLKSQFTGEDSKAGDQEISLAEMKEAVRILWGETDLNTLPQPEPLKEIPPRSVRVAVASNTGEQLDGHFGSCLRFLIYQLSEDTCQLIDLRSAIDADAAEDKNAYRASLVDDCQVLYVVSVGGPAAAKIVRSGIYPIKKPQGGDAKEVLAQLQGVMKTSPPPWLAKYLGDDAESRIRFSRVEEELVG